MSEQKQAIWRKVDLHIHPPHLEAPGRGEGFLLDLLRRAEEQSLDIVGLVDHNSVRGYEQLRLEMSRLIALKETDQLTAEQEAVLSAYERLLEHMLLLPGFELMTRDGINVLALFPPAIAAEKLYALLLNLGVPMERLREASVDIRAQTDLAAACALISQAGGVVIVCQPAAEHGPGLAAGEALPPGVLALELSSLPEEPASGPLALLWSSRANCLQTRPEGMRPAEIGEQYTEILMEEFSLAGLKDTLARKEPERLRYPEYKRLHAHMDWLRQQVTEQLILCGAEMDPHLIHREIAALANAGGGILMIGLTEEEVVGVEDPETWSATLSRLAREQIDPTPRLNLELLRYGEKEVIRVEVDAEAPPPYVVAEGVVYVRKDQQTRPATRQELVDLLAAGSLGGGTATAGLDLPQAGVEIVGTYLRDGVWFYDVRDLRVTSGVTRHRAKGLWAYAIERQESLRQGRVDVARIRWKGDRGIWRAYRSGERRVYDLVHRDASGRLDHVFYGVSEWGLTPSWREVVEALRPPLDEAPGPPIGGKGKAEEVRAPRPVRDIREAAVAEVPVEGVADEAAPAEVLAVAACPEAAAEPSPREEVAKEVAAETAEVVPVRPSPDAWGGHLPRWRNQAAVERVYWETNKLFFDLALRQEDNQVRHFRHVHRDQLTGAEGWIDLVRVPLPATGVEVVRSTASGDEVLYQFRDMQSGRVDPRVRRKTDFPDDSPYAYAIRMYHQDTPLDDGRVRWWGNIGYLRRVGERVDLVYRDEEGRNHIYYAAEPSMLEGEWRELLTVWKED